MNCPYCNKYLQSGLTTALSHDCCAEKPISLKFKEGKTIGYVYYKYHFKIISSSYYNNTIIYLVRNMNGLILENKVFNKINSFINPKDIDKKLKTILVFS